MKLILLIFLCLLFTIFLDFIYIKLIGEELFKSSFPELLRSNYKIWPALLTWLLIVIGSYIFVYNYAILNIQNALIYGALYGLILYGVYELTNFTIFTAWSLKVVLIDLSWGVILNMLIALFWYFVGRNVF